jgi:pantoate--beta-alanine ligase
VLIFHKVTDIQNYLSNNFWDKKTIGFVPTMGALHQGHLSIIKQSKAENDITITSIFVNPTQFNNKDDFDKYPSTIGTDIEKLVDEGADVLLLPNVSEMYPDGTLYEINFDAGYLDTIMEGTFRPGHFKGVAQIVKRLLDIVQPTTLYLGQKDYQQFMVVKKMITDLKIPVYLKMASTLREEDGLAMSSRNMRLDEASRRNAVSVFAILKKAATDAKQYSVAEAKANALKSLQEIPQATPEYLEFANAENLALIEKYDISVPTVICVAVWIGGIRLIDNIIL